MAHVHADIPDQFPTSGLRPLQGYHLILIGRRAILMGWQWSLRIAVERIALILNVPYVDLVGVEKGKLWVGFKDGPSQLEGRE